MQTDHDPYLVELEIVGQVQGVLLDDNRIITNKGQKKWFEISFDSLGAGTCVVLDYKDGLVAAYGEKEFCQKWPRSSRATYIEGHEVIEDPFNIDHRYL